MWFITRNILQYLCNEDIPNEKRIKVIKNNKNKVIEELLKLSYEDLVKLLFNSKVIKELKLVICEEIDKLAKRSDGNSKFITRKIIEEFKKLNYCKDKYLLSDTCPNVFKEEIINELYPKAYNAVKDVKVSKKVKKVIMKLSLSTYDFERLLKSDLTQDMKEYIIDECLDSSYGMKSVLDNSEISNELKDRLIDRKINKDNLFSVLEYADTSTIEYVLEKKSKEFEEFLNKLTPANVLTTINSASTPKKIVVYIFKYRKDIIEKAVDIAGRNELEDTIKYEKNSDILNLIYKRRTKSVYQVINKLFDFQLMSFLSYETLPKEYKDYIINKKKGKLNGYINRMSAWDCINYTKNDSFVPDEIKERIINTRKNDILKYYADDKEENILSTIRLSNLNLTIRKMLITEKVNINNIFNLLSYCFIDKETIDLVVELKKDVLIKIFSSYDNKKLFRGKFEVLKEDVVEEILNGSEDFLRERVHKLEEDELYSYVSSGKVLSVVKKLILERLGIEKDNINNVLILISMYDTKLILDNYQNIMDLICGLGIDFNSFLQYGSGSKKYSNWLDNLLEIIFNDDIGDFAWCKDYLFNNYYKNNTENSVYIISSFLEYLDNYGKYKELFMNLVDNKVKLTKEDKDNLKFLFNISGVSKEDSPKSIYDLKKFKLKLYRNYISYLDNPMIDLDRLKRMFNNILFCNAQEILSNIGGTGALRTLKKDNIESCTISELVDELMLCSSIIEMVNYTNNEDGIKNVLKYIFSDMEVLTKIQNIFANFEDKVRRLYELDSMNNLSTLSDARRLGMIDVELSKKYGGEVFDFSDKNYCLYGHILSHKENIADMVEGISTGSSNFISVSPVSYRGQKYYYDRNNVIFAYDSILFGSFICSSIRNMGSNGSVKANSSEVGNIGRLQRGILETSAVVDNNAEALLYREGLKPCGLILPGGRTPSKKELEIHEKFGLPFIITQELHKSIDNPKYMFVNDLSIEINDSDLIELKNIFDMLKPNVTHVKENSQYTGREIGVFTDCHSMYEPTLAILEDMKRKGITEIYSLGDNVGLGPNPVEVFDLLDEFKVKSVAGNAEYYNTIGVDAFPYLGDVRLESQAWTERKLGPERIKELKMYPASRDIMLGNRKIALCHFANDVRWDFRDRSVHTFVKSFGCNTEQLRYTNSEAAIRKITNCVVSNRGNISAVKGYMAAREEPIFGGKLVTDYDCILQGHYHFDLYDILDETEIYTLRAVAMGYEGTEKDNEACYYILRERKDGDIEIEKVYVPFNRNALLSSIHTCDLPSKEQVLSYVRKSR